MTTRTPRPRSGRARAGARRRKLTPRNAGAVSVSSPDWLIQTPYLREAGVYITRETALQVSAVYGCIRLIVDSIAPADVEVVEVMPNGRREVRADDPIAYTLNWGAPIPRAPDAPSAQAIEEALYWTAMSGDGNAYAEIQWDNANRFFALWPLEPDRVMPRRDRDGALYYEINQPTGGTVALPPSRIFHLRGPSLLGYVGSSIVYQAAKAIGIAQAAQVFSAAYFANGTVLSGYLKTPKSMTPDQQKTHGASWKKNYAGLEKAHGTPVLHSGMEYVQLNHDAQKSQLVESRRFQVQEVARFFGVPTTLLADNEAWTNLSELYLGFYRNALRPWVERFDAEATRKLFPMRQPWREVRHDLTPLTMGSFKDMVAGLRDAVNGGLWTRNEARAVMGKNSLGDEGDEIVVEGTVKSLEDVLDPPEPPAPMLPAAPPEPDEDDVKDAPEPVNVARIAVALDRFARKVDQRRRDLERKSPEKLDENLAALRAEAAPALIEECRKAAHLVDASGEFGDAVIKAADAVIAGEPAHLAADRMVSK